MTDAQTHQTVITADTDVPIVRIVREFEAPPAKVFTAHVDPELVVRWLGPSRHEIHVDYWDARTGGSFRYVMSSGGRDFGFHGSFHELRPSELIVQTFTFESEPDGVALEKLVLENVGDGRTRLTSTSLVDSFESRDAWMSSGMQSGAVEGYERLDTLIAD